LSRFIHPHPVKKTKTY